MSSSCAAHIPRAGPLNDSIVRPMIDSNRLSGSASSAPSALRARSTSSPHSPTNS